MINYKIIKCYKLFNNKINFYQNYGFYIGTTIYIIIFTLFIIYIIYGSKIIKIKYLRYEPKNEENQIGININNNIINNEINMVDSDVNIINKNKKTSSLFHNRDNNYNHKIKCKKCRAHCKNKIIFEFNPPIKKHSNVKKRRKNHKNIFNDDTIKIEKLEINNNKDNFDISMKNSDEDISNEKIKNQNEIKFNINDINATLKNKNDIEYNELTFEQALINDERNIVQTFISYFNSKLDLIQIIFFPKEFSHISLTLSSYLFELLLDLTFNALLFSDDVISQKYYNNGDLLFITSNILSISSNIITSLIIYFIENLVKYETILENAIQEIKNNKLFFQFFTKIYHYITIKIRIFYFIVFISGLFCIYYLFIFFAIFKKIQKNLFINYIIGIGWGLGYKVALCLITTIMRKISLIKKYKRLYIIAKFIDDKF